MAKSDCILKRAVSVTALLLLGAVVAQEFVFSTDRLKAEPAIGVTGAQLLQNELFLYRDGSELRLTDTPTEGEWGPVPSPSGRYVAYVVQDQVIDWDSEGLVMDWDWHLRVLELESGHVVGSWLLPETTGHMWPAGGFDIGWQQDEQVLYSQIGGALDAGGGIVRVELGSENEPELVTRGFGVHVDSSRGWLATSLHGSAAVYVPLSGETLTLATGSALGWADTRVVVADRGQLSLIDPVTAERTVIDDEDGTYIAFATEDGGYRHAWVRYQSEQGMSVIVVADEQFQTMSTWLYADFVTSAGWLPGGTLLLNVMMGNHMAIMELDVAEGTEFVLVSSSIRDNRDARPLPLNSHTP